MSEEETVDIGKELDDLLTKVQPDLQDVIKRSFTNVALQLAKNGEQIIRDKLDDTFYFAKNTQVNLSALELVKSPTFHMQGVSLDLKSMMLSLRCSLGEINVKGQYSAFNENLYNLIPVLAEGHVVISLSNVTADVNVGLVVDDDAYSFINPGIEFTHDEVLVKLSWPSPQRNGGYEFVTTEQLAKHIDDLPLSAAISLPLFALLRQRLQHHLARVLRRTASVSELMCCNPCLLEAYSEMVHKLAESGNKVVDMVLINMRRTLLQTRCEVLPLPPLHATFLHKIGSTSFVGRFETDAGWVKNLATVNRINDVSVWRPDPLKTCFSVTLRIKDLQTINGKDVEPRSLLTPHRSHYRKTDLEVGKGAADGVKCCSSVMEEPALEHHENEPWTPQPRSRASSWSEMLLIGHGGASVAAPRERAMDAAASQSGVEYQGRKGRHEQGSSIKKVGYEEYRIKALGASCSGRMAATFADNTLRLALSVGLARWEPYAQLDDLQVLQMDGMDLHSTGLGPLCGTAPLGAWARGAAALAAPALAAQLTRELHTALAELRLWDMLYPL